ncbi:MULTISPECIES: ScbA/BarX family gamma-butyrolactone biosynthesis protein [unclassified Streptomyces]|uniref:ScbA/BarX family gamma-butyrolactone biosynthesis protein n=1 Tax=Streptomyces TaxID=1883 RepID=UPI0001C19D8C|nr:MULTISPECIES: ScbA/BarX family gamma-butyrolactone biosynthesis protein [unclassified Streptomyces]AEN14093.1 A-factor biosynthesis repeat-containing protein [Streptomyces sp. SirexAA-E]MYR67682.1 A-factor biosynthesis protein [Streptomyces sp. SID4939]MYS02470.1 A-factor biosynthesis protein [Streptomyces sp. SID4940]MYT67981.1 A-factor biosynthesis protein [Streptomyces sp. SID8357]MYT86824.1 A-factor biosynthesis protein [Streptomyces sp. SID8360]
MSARRQAYLSDDTRRRGSAELFQQTVPRALVHRSAVSEVLVTGVRHGSDGVHQVGAQWSRAHSYYGPVAGRWHDPMLFAETIRQACILLAHQTLDIPLAHPFLTTTHAFTILTGGARLTDQPADVLLEISLHDVVRRGPRVSAFACSIDAYREGEPIGIGRSSANCVSPSVYKRLRGHRFGAACPGQVPAPLPHELVGRGRASDVVLGRSPEAGTWLLRADTSHPILFDHPVDHVPGMVLMEAARQAALLTVGCPDGLLVSCAATFHKYVEFDVPCVVSSSPVRELAPGRHELTVTFTQADSLVGACELTVLDGMSL